MNNNKNKVIFISLGLLVAIVFVFYLASYVVPKVLVTMSKATSVGKVSLAKSFILGEKIMANADGIDKCVVSVFVIDADGKGISGKQIQLNGLGNQNAVTDSVGKATFELSSTVARQYELTASVNGSPIGKTFTITFR